MDSIFFALWFGPTLLCKEQSLIPLYSHSTPFPNAHTNTHPIPLQFVLLPWIANPAEHKRGAHGKLLLEKRPSALRARKTGKEQPAFPGYICSADCQCHKTAQKRLRMKGRKKSVRLLWISACTALRFRWSLCPAMQRGTHKHRAAEVSHAKTFV